MWANFLPAFHTSLIECMVTLSPPGYPVSKGKKTLFVFLLEILNGNGIKAKVFWHTKKKHSQASREV
jgi:hypothetical protein